MGNSSSSSSSHSSLKRSTVVFGPNQKVFKHVSPLDSNGGVVVEPKSYFIIRKGQIKVLLGKEGRERKDLPKSVVRSWAVAGGSISAILKTAASEGAQVESFLEAVPGIADTVRRKLRVELSGRCEGVMYTYVGVPVSAETFLSWRDYEQYRMYSTVKTENYTLRIGVRERHTIRVICYIEDSGVDIIIRNNMPVPLDALTRDPTQKKVGAAKKKPKKKTKGGAAGEKKKKSSSEAVKKEKSSASPSTVDDKKKPPTQKSMSPAAAPQKSRPSLPSEEKVEEKVEEV